MSSRVSALPFRLEYNKNKVWDQITAPEFANSVNKFNTYVFWLFQGFFYWTRFVLLYCSWYYLNSIFFVEAYVSRLVWQSKKKNKFWNSRSAMLRVKGKKKIKKNYRFGRLLHYYYTRKGGNLFKAMRFYINVIRKKKKTFKIVDDTLSKSWGNYNSLFSWWIYSVARRIQKQTLSKLPYSATATVSRSILFDKLLSAKNVKKSFAEFKNERSSFFLTSFLKQLAGRIQRKQVYALPGSYFLARLHFYFFKCQLFLGYSRAKKSRAAFNAVAKKNRKYIAQSLIKDRQQLSARLFFKQNIKKQQSPAIAAAINAKPDLGIWKNLKARSKKSRLSIGKRLLKVASGRYVKSLTMSIARRYNMWRQLRLQNFFWFYTLKKKRGDRALRGLMQGHGKDLIRSVDSLFSKGFGSCFVAPGLLPKSLDSVFLKKALLRGKSLFIKMGWMFSSSARSVNLMPCLRSSKSLNYMQHLVKISKSKLVNFEKSKKISKKKVGFFKYSKAAYLIRAVQLWANFLRARKNVIGRRFFLLTPGLIGVLKKKAGSSKSPKTNFIASNSRGRRGTSVALRIFKKTWGKKLHAFKPRHSNNKQKVFKFTTKLEVGNLRTPTQALEKRDFKKILRSSKDVGYSKKRALWWQYTKVNATRGSTTVKGYNGYKSKQNRMHSGTANIDFGVLYRGNTVKKKEFFRGGAQPTTNRVGRFKDRLPPYFVSRFFKYRASGMKRRALRKIFNIPAFTKAVSLTYRRQFPRSQDSGLGGVTLLKLNFFNYSAALNQFFSKKFSNENLESAQTDVFLPTQYTPASVSKSRLSRLYYRRSEEFRLKRQQHGLSIDAFNRKQANLFFDKGVIRDGTAIAGTVLNDGVVKESVVNVYQNQHSGYTKNKKTSRRVNQKPVILKKSKHILEAAKFNLEGSFSRAEERLIKIQNSLSANLAYKKNLFYEGAESKRTTGGAKSLLTGLRLLAGDSMKKLYTEEGDHLLKSTASETMKLSTVSEKVIKVELRGKAADAVSAAVHPNNNNKFNKFFFSKRRIYFALKEKKNCVWRGAVAGFNRNFVRRLQKEESSYTGAAVKSVKSSIAGFRYKKNKHVVLGRGQRICFAVNSAKLSSRHMGGYSKIFKGRDRYLVYHCSARRRSNKNLYSFSTAARTLSASEQFTKNTSNKVNRNLTLFKEARVKNSSRIAEYWLRHHGSGNIICPGSAKLRFLPAEKFAGLKTKTRNCVLKKRYRSISWKPSFLCRRHLPLFKKTKVIAAATTLGKRVVFQKILFFLRALWIRRRLKELLFKKGHFNKGKLELYSKFGRRRKAIKILNFNQVSLKMLGTCGNGYSQAAAGQRAWRSASQSSGPGSSYVGLHTPRVGLGLGLAGNLLASDPAAQKRVRRRLFFYKQRIDRFVRRFAFSLNGSAAQGAGAVERVEIGVPRTRARIDLIEAVSTAALKSSGLLKLKKNWLNKRNFKKKQDRLNGGYMRKYRLRRTLLNEGGSKFVFFGKLGCSAESSKKNFFFFFKPLTSLVPAAVPNLFKSGLGDAAHYSFLKRLSNVKDHAPRKNQKLFSFKRLVGAFAHGKNGRTPRDPRDGKKVLLHCKDLFSLNFFFSERKSFLLDRYNTHFLSEKISRLLKNVVYLTLHGPNCMLRKFSQERFLNISKWIVKFIFFPAKHLPVIKTLIFLFFCCSSLGYYYSFVFFIGFILERWQYRKHFKLMSAIKTLLWNFPFAPNGTISLCLSIRGKFNMRPRARTVQIMRGLLPALQTVTFFSEYYYTMARNFFGAFGIHLWVYMKKKK